MMFQSTRPHGARPDWDYYRRVAIGVSIHAPTRGATQVSICFDRLHGVSIHAPTRGATPLRIHPRFSFLRFNPRAHTGRDTQLIGGCMGFSGFNPRAHTGRDL